MKWASRSSLKEFVREFRFSKATITGEDASWPRISIVTPSYNQAEYLERTILSVLNQDYPNLEYIIIDGGSSDGSADIIRKYEPFLAYWISEPDNGQAAAINKGMRRATGQVLAWLNSDDVYCPGALAKAGLSFRQNPDVDLVFGDTFFIDPGDGIIDELKFTRFSLKSYIYKAFGLHQPSSFWLKKAFDEMEQIDERYQFCMDTDFFLRMAKERKRFFHLNEYLAGFRITETQKSATISLVGLEERRKIIKELYDISIDYGSFRLKAIKLIYQIRRFSLYLFKGELGYVYRLIKRRIKDAFHHMY